MITRMSSLFLRTLREDPADAEVPSHKLLVRAGYVRRVAPGGYSWLPLGIRVLRKIEEIVREEMNAIGAQEIQFPALLPREPYEATGRWTEYGDNVFRLKDRKNADYMLGPTHEEAVTPLVAGEFTSYRDLPVNLYQIEWKYRDEFRPRFGLLRVREFLMKDAYSFDRDEEGMRASYAAMVEAYRQIFGRCGLDYRVVEADPGQIGGDVNHEFMALAPIGEDEFVYCENCDYAADIEAATSRPPEPAADGELEPATKIQTPGRSTIQAVSELLGRPASALMKCILYDAGGRTVAVLIPVRRRGFRWARLREGLRGPAGPSGRCHDHRRSLGPSRPQLGDRSERGRPPRERGQRGPRLPRGSVGGRGPGPPGRSVSSLRRKPPLGQGHRGRTHLPARHEILQGAQGHVRGRGRDRAALPDGVLRDRATPDHRRCGRAGERRSRHQVAEGAGPLRRRGHPDEHGHGPR